MQYGYQWEKLNSARHALMLPHLHGIDGSIADAFHECTLAFHEMDEAGLDDNAREWVATIQELMNTRGVHDATGEGTWRVKARSLTADQQLELSRVVDELAHWFGHKFWDHK